MKRLRRGQSLVGYETTRIHKDGHPIDVSVTISPAKNKVGKIVGASVVVRDITKQKQAEAALRLSEERLQVAIKNAAIVVFTQDLQLRYTWITPPVMAWDRRNYVGRTDAELFGGEQGARLTAIKQEALSSGVGAHNEVSITFEGVTHYLDLVVEPLRDAGGELLGVISSAVDITRWNELIVKLKEALNEVKLLSGLLSICAACKRITDEHGTWIPLEAYIQTHSEAKFTHGLCPDCLRKLYPEYYPG